MQSISGLQTDLRSSKLPSCFSIKLRLDNFRITTRRFFLSSLNVIFAHVLNKMKQGSQPNIKLPKQIIAESKDSFSCSKGGGK